MRMAGQPWDIDHPWQVMAVIGCDKGEATGEERHDERFTDRPEN